MKRFGQRFFSMLTAMLLLTTFARAEPVQASPWVWKNTVCSFGPSFQSVDASLTDKWYTFTAVDLSEDGIQSFDLVAGGTYRIGQVYVNVMDGTVRVTYRYVCPSQIYEEEAFFTIFPEAEDITGVEPEALEAMNYGDYYSIAEDLNGDTSVLLFVCNRVSFLKDTPGVERFYDNSPENRRLRQEMLERLNGEV